MINYSYVYVYNSSQQQYSKQIEVAMLVVYLYYTYIAEHSNAICQKLWKDFGIFTHHTCCVFVSIFKPTWVWTSFEVSPINQQVSIFY